MSTENPLPRWDLTPIFPSLESPEFAAEFNTVLAAVDALTTQFDSLAIRRRESAAVDAAFVADFEAVVGAMNDLYERLDALRSYIGCHVTTDATDETAKSRQSEMETRTVQLGQLWPRFVAWVGSSDVESLLAQSAMAREHEFPVRRAAIAEKHQMSEAEENLAASLLPVGLRGWAKLHSDVSALLTATVEVKGEAKTLPMSGIRALASDPDRAVRQTAFETEIEAWKTVTVPLAAALNGVKGFQREVRDRRHFPDDVAPTLIDNSIDAATLSAMQTAMVESFPDFQRYMRAKAKALGTEKLAWWDLVAPVGGDDKKWTWAECETAIEENFGRYSAKLAAFARRAFEERWIDAGPRVGKVGGAYCTQSRPGESRVLMNFDGSFTDVSTLAHELGHAYHNLCMAERTPLQTDIPMTLAETASIFCETLIFEAAVAKADRAGRIALLDNSLSGKLMVIVDIHSRFLFEKAVFEKRADRDLTESEFCDLMTRAQRATYGDAVEPLHPYMWAVKPHYYGPTFYNYPYAFGLLLGLGLYAQYQANPDSFRDRYDDFLSRCGMADAQSLARDFGFDLTTPEFWRGSLDIVRGQIGEFEGLVDGL